MADARHSRRWREHTVPRIIRRDGGICHLCGLPDATTADHLTPVSQGGTDDPSNLAAAHTRCNRIRGDRPVDQIRAELTARQVAATAGWDW